MSYSDIDPVIDTWVERHGLTLFTHYEGYEDRRDLESRAIYTSGESGECCQIWLEPPRQGEVTIHAADVETIMDEKFKREWRVPMSNLEAALEHALAEVREWMRRPLVDNSWSNSSSSGREEA